VIDFFSKYWSDGAAVSAGAEDGGVSVAIGNHHLPEGNVPGAAQVVPHVQQRQAARRLGQNLQQGRQPALEHGPVLDGTLADLRPESAIHRGRQGRWYLYYIRSGHFELHQKMRLLDE